MKILATGDWHLDAYTAGFDRYNDICHGIDETIDAFEAIDDIDLLYVFLGDLTDPTNVRAVRSIAKAVEVATHVTRINTAMIDGSAWIVGNHDIIADGSGLSTLEPLRAMGCHVIDRPTVSVYRNGQLVIYLPYPNPAMPYDPVEFIEGLQPSPGVDSEKPPFVFGHLSHTGVTAASESSELARGRDVFWPVEAIRKKWPNARMVGGHYHKRQRANGVEFVGSLERLTFGEQDNQPSYLILEA